MDGKKHTASYHLPHDIIENILSRLPVKSLLRLKGVCKQWSDTISDPKFAETHVQQSKNSSCTYLDLRQTGSFIRRVRLENLEFRVLSASEYLPVELCKNCTVVCHCDGLLLIWCSDDGYVLWNPSRKRHRKLHCDRKFGPGPAGIIYDPLVKDYKVVIGDMMHYAAVFYCKTNSWSQINVFSFQVVSSSCCLKGVTFNGSIYWIFFSRLGKGDTHRFRFEIVCLNGRDEKFRNLRKLDFRADNAYLTCSGDGLYLFPIYKYDVLKNEIVIMEKVGDDDDDDAAWMELKVQLPFLCYFVRPLCWTHQNKIVLEACDSERNRKYLLYDHSKRCMAEIQNSSDLVGFYRLFPDLENLFLL